MSFTGDLEHLPIVDVIQLLHSARKSGILRVSCRKGDSELVFKDGYIVSASHLNNSVRIGAILIDLKIITQEILDSALQEQKNAGEERKPLIITLLDMGLVREADAYKGLEHLIEMTIVEILTWKRGTFVLDMLPKNVADGYRYYPTKMGKEINVDTQSVLMDSLRIFDEKMRDGELVEEEFAEDEFPTGEPSGSDGDQILSADDLGLEDLDQLEKKIPKYFKGLDETDPGKIHQQKIAESAPYLTGEEQDALATFLGKFSGRGRESGAVRGEPGQSVVLFSADELIIHAITTVCKPSAIQVVVSGDDTGVMAAVAQAVAGNRLPSVVFDAPASFGNLVSLEKMASLRRKVQAGYAGIDMIQLSAGSEFTAMLSAYSDGVRGVLPRPVRTERRDAFLPDALGFLEVLPSYLCRTGTADGALLERLRGGTTSLRRARDAQEVALAILQFVAEFFERSLTLIVREGELVAEKGIGIAADKGLGPSSPLGSRIPLAGSSLFRRVIEEGNLYLGNGSDEAVSTLLFAAIGAPVRSTVLLFPLTSQGKTVAVIYGDFGGKEALPVPTELLEIMKSQADLVLENVLCRKKMEKASP
jgi:uncharacterized protein DUF4388